MTYKKCQKNAQIFECIKCNFVCSKISNMLAHTSTRKHADTYKYLHKNAVKNFTCLCGNQYKHRQSLYNHQKLCSGKKNAESSEDEKCENVMFEILKQNQEFQKMILEQNKIIVDLSAKSNTNITNNMNTNSNNKFNLQFFLNETCKDALNITDFIDSLQLSLTDLENFGNRGFVDGISRIFVNGLKELEVNKRPIHCCDLKRETMYIKNSDAWEKENEENNNLKNAIKCIADKNIQNISEWKEANPDCRDGESKKNDQYLQIINKSIVCVSKEEAEENYKKIIKTIAKETIIEKP